ncbi:unnamed protein product [Linum tenue]|uniref:Response regulatory domain-containing protein n=1 Tax=Linum tenue TaxID=586396 RepID=A0AAV0IT64_9ROSI|nr:unnamed protein product [Linum tenue]
MVVTAVDSRSKALEFLGLHNNNNHHSPASAANDDISFMPGISFIITDYCMPGMSGYELVRRIKESESFKDIPVVIMSSENVPSIINRCLARRRSSRVLPQAGSISQMSTSSNLTFCDHHHPIAAIMMEIMMRLTMATLFICINCCFRLGMMMILNVFVGDKYSEMIIHYHKSG